MEQTKRTQKNHHNLQTQVKRVKIYSKERQVDTKMQGPRTELTKLQLLDQFMHSCICGEIQLRKEQFINHINKKHEGMVPPRSQINGPPESTQCFSTRTKQKSCIVRPQRT